MIDVIVLVDKIIELEVEVLVDYIENVNIDVGGMVFEFSVNIDFNSLLKDIDKVVVLEEIVSEKNVIVFFVIIICFVDSVVEKVNVDKNSVSEVFEEF